MAWGKDEALPHEELHAIASFFHIGRLLEARWAGGYSNKNYVVTTDAGEFLVKFLFNQRVDICKEIVYTTYLKQHGFPTVDYLVSPTGSLLWEVGGARAVVEKKLPGQPPPQSDHVCRVMGTHLARLHTLPLADLPPTNSDLGKDYVRVGLQRARSVFDERTLHPLLVASERLSHFQVVRLPQSIVHGDPTRHNCLFSGESLVSLIDWEEVGISAALLDTAVAILSFCYQYAGPTRPHLEISWYHSFLEGYQKIRPLTQQEEEQLASALHYAALVISIWGLLQFGIYYPDQALLQDWLHPALEIENEDENM